MKTFTQATIAVAAACALLAGVVVIIGATRSDEPKQATQPAADPPEQVGASMQSSNSTAADASAPYSLVTCPISGKALGSMGRPVIKQYDGREVRFCCAGCIEEFEKDAPAHWRSIDERLVQQQLMHYPLDTCIVSGEKLGSRGEPVNHVHKNRLVRFCCPDCIGAFEKKPAEYLRALDERIADAQRAAYPLASCPVMATGLEAMGGIVDITYMNRLVRLCCQPCVTTFEKSPQRYMEMIDAAYADRQREAYPLETCVVSGEKLGSRGELRDVIAGGTLVRLCCDKCLPKLQERPGEYLEKVRAAKTSG